MQVKKGEEEQGPNELHVEAMVHTHSVKSFPHTLGELRCDPSRHH